MQYNIPTDKEIAEKAKALIIADLRQSWQLAEVAALVHVTSFTLRRIFKRQYGTSLSDFVLQVKMEKAKELLVTTNNTIQMIAEALGYVEGNNFQKRFKKVTGMTPGEWRKKSGRSGN